MVNSRSQSWAKIFDDYATDVILPDVKSCIDKYSKVDIVFDVY